MNITATASLSSISATASIGHTVSGGDTTPPVFSAGPSSVNVDETSFQITATLDEWGTVYSLVQLAASAAPSIATVISTGESAIDTGSGVTINHTGLDDNTAYTAYLVAVDDDDNTQAALSEVDVTTDNAVDPPVLSSVVISDETPTTIDVDGSVDLDGSTVFAYILDRGVAAPNAATIEANADDSVVSAGGVFAFDDLATALSIDPDGLATLHLVAKKDGVYSNVVSTDVDYFTLESLGLSLDLRTPNSAFANDLEANSSGLIGFRSAVTLGGLDDVNVIIDQSQGLAEGKLLASHEFSTDADGVTNAQGTTVLGAQTVGGFSDCLTVTCDTSTGYHEIELVSLNNNYRKVLKVEFDIYLHSGGAISGGYYKTNDVGGISNLFGISFYNGLPLDTWTTVKVYGYNNGSLGNTIGFYNGSAASFTGTTNDKVSFRNIRVVEVLGKHFTQTATAKMPHWNNVNCTVDFDGTDDELNDLGGNFFATISADTQGEFINVFEDDEGTGVTLVPYRLSNGSFTNYFYPVIDTGDDYNLAHTGPNEAIEFDNNLTRSIRTTIFQGSNGAAYSCQINGVDKSANSGTNNGHWVGDTAGLTEISIGDNASGSDYYAFGMGSFHYRSTQLTVEERTNTKTWLDNNV